MTHETDIPCAECGTDLVERDVDVSEVPASTTERGQVTVAECPTCEARYYPQETLDRLSRGSTDPSNDTRPRGDS